MIELRDITYVRLGTRDLEGATRYATQILGLEVAERSGQAVYFRSDAREHTLCYFDGDPADHVAAFEVASRAELDAAAAELERIGHPVHAGTRAECEQRKVRDFIAFHDPTGNRIELVWRPQMSGRRFHGTRDAGITGFSHIGLCTTDAARDEAFWTRVCNARVSDHIGEAPLLRIGKVHHTLALFPTDRKGIQHVNHQMASTDDIQRAYNFIRERNVPVVFGPGKHPTSSARFLYFEGPDGMVYEYSSGVCEIDDEAAWRNRQFEAAPRGFCEWGATPDIKEFKA
ncbi:glyoxalase/bleomycin resistance/extradiol dioxygenase family protein [Pseudoxanthomonas broegbernensis]|uniref:Glyoxalase/bleomycin resistance/extradiol dioxygenase family protein n=1 Tax=Pseudoxanthomonas broegbernensis TaxID=83619 RepID=A0A7V8K6H3_9GAMM|nr:VOC family protein [Pseudoxanthomonas broegbernensis]KAF1685101.1 glyoxalase/bleomycin resistance/extradiol dioxygenase family protein [Pseudoxanthomonas broegbernensis]MBB6066236.1 2,3-dihydroxy-p-cumate/2,3-dihydroxybenzoate 3,4-dioxygenase [Pseudoxanthomonas broegbernensis]